MNQKEAMKDIEVLRRNNTELGLKLAESYARESALREVAVQMLDILDMSAGKGRRWEGAFADKCRAMLKERAG